MLTLRRDDVILECWPASIMRRDYNVLVRTMDAAIAKHPDANAVDFHWTQKMVMGIDFKPNADMRLSLAVLANQYDEWTLDGIYCGVCDVLYREKEKNKHLHGTIIG